jgi:hypothetical protein
MKTTLLTLTEKDTTQLYSQTFIDFMKWYANQLVNEGLSVEDALRDSKESEQMIWAVCDPNRALINKLIKTSKSKNSPKNQDIDFLYVQEYAQHLHEFALRTWSRKQDFVSEFPVEQIDATEETAAMIISFAQNELIEEFSKNNNGITDSQQRQIEFTIHWVNNYKDKFFNIVQRDADQTRDMQIIAGLTHTLSYIYNECLNGMTIPEFKFSALA